MIAFSECVFDEIIHGAATDFYTANRFNEALGKPDKLTVQAIVDNADANGTILVQIEHSADQRNWSSKNTTAEINNPASSISSTSTVGTVGADAGTNATLPFVRLRIRMTTSARAHAATFPTPRAASPPRAPITPTSSRSPSTTRRPSSKTSTTWRRSSLSTRRSRAWRR